MSPFSTHARFWLLHLLTWLGFILYEQAIVFFTATARLDAPYTLFLYLLNAAVFYGNSEWLLPRLYAPGHYARYLGAASVLLVGYALTRSELSLHWLPVNGGATVTYKQMWVLALYRGSFFLFVSLGYWYAQTTLRLATQRQRHEEQLRQTERDLFDANLKFLKSQINPHFLFNTLNFLYAEVYPHSDKAAQAILLLSDAMRYALHEDNQRKVMLTQEVQHLQNYLLLNQLRFHHQLQVQFECTGSLHFLRILPLILITFVENCFKHGELTDATDPLVIRLAITENQLAFYTHNRKRVGPKEQSTGIGLANTRQRLAMIYPAHHALQVEETPTHYTCRLTLSL